MTLPILILAAGASSRMGDRDKLSEMAHGKPLLRHVVTQALEVSGDVYVALYHRAEDRIALLDGLAITPLMTPEATEGMGGTMRAAVRHLPDCPAFVLLLSDLPDIGATELRAVLAARDENPDALIWRGATRDGAPGHPIIFDASLRPSFETLSGDTGGEPLVNPLRDRTVLVPFADNRARFDLDTPSDWAAWRRRDQT